MSEIGQTAADFFAVCEQHTDAICKLLAPLRDGEMKIAWQAALADLDDVPSGSLLLEWKTGGNQISWLLPATAAPEWVAAPDESQSEVLQKLADDAVALLNEGAEFSDVKSLTAGDAEMRAMDAMQAAGVAFLPFDLTHGEETARGYVIHGAVPKPQTPPPAPATADEEATQPAQETTPQTATPPQPAPAQGAKRPVARKGQLPGYTKSLLKICVPVSVSLATTQMPVQRILEIGEGTIIQFSKSCEESLTLHAGSQAIAEGEAVKVGDKFGFRISHMTTPQERFLPVAPGKSS